MSRAAFARVPGSFRRLLVAAAAMIALLASPADAARRRPIVTPEPPPVVMEPTGLLLGLTAPDYTSRLAYYDLETRSVSDIIPAWPCCARQIAGPSFAPDGRKFVIYDSGAGGLAVVDLETKSSTPLVPVSRNSGAPPAWSPDGRWIVYGDVVGEQKTSWGDWNVDLFVIGVDPATGAQREPAVNITNSLERVEKMPQWSRKGDRLSSTVSTARAVTELFILTLATDRKSVIAGESLSSVIGAGYFGSSQPQWTRSSRLPDAIVFGQWVEERLDLRFVEADSRRVGTLLQGARAENELWALSPDGEQVAVVQSDGKTRTLSIVKNLRALFLGGATPEIELTPLRTGVNNLHWFEHLTWRP